MSVTLLTLSSERSQHDCAVAKNSNADRISELCFTACPRTGVLKSSDDSLCNFARGLSPQRRWEHAAQTATRHSASLLVHELVFCGLLMKLSATSYGDFPYNVVGSMLSVCVCCEAAFPVETSSEGNRCIGRGMHVSSTAERDDSIRGSNGVTGLRVRRTARPQEDTWEREA